MPKQQEDFHKIAYAESMQYASFFLKGNEWTMGKMTILAGNS